MFLQPFFQDNQEHAERLLSKRNELSVLRAAASDRELRENRRTLLRISERFEIRLRRTVDAGTDLRLHLVPEVNLDVMSNVLLVNVGEADNDARRAQAQPLEQEPILIDADGRYGLPIFFLSIWIERQE